MNSGVARIPSLGGRKGRDQGKERVERVWPGLGGQKGYRAWSVTIELTRGYLCSPLSWPALKCHTICCKTE